jgi:phosphoglycerate dehydrogenase-like enzyme
MPRVLNMFGDRVREAALTVPGVEVVDLPFDDAPPPDLRGEILFAAWVGSPVYDHLDDLGVEWMHLPATGVDAWPRALLEGRTVTCARGASGIPIAEFVLACMLAFEKRLPETWLDKPTEQWNVARLGEIKGKTLGIVGLGGIGIEVAKRALAFDMRVRALRRHPEVGSPVAGVELAADVGDLLRDADHVVIAAPATTATEYLIDAAALDRVKPGVHLVNVARGTLVDQDALRIALDDGRVALASLDTVVPEPLPAGHWLYEHPKVRLSAHVSWSSPVAFDRIIESFVVNLRRFVAGEPLEGVIDADEGY